MQTITSDSHVIAALVKYAQVRDTPSFDAALVKLRTEQGLAQAVNLAGPFIMSSQGKP
jgi:hypothetical protein